MLTARLFSSVSVPFCISPAMSENSSCFASSPIVDTIIYEKYLLILVIVTWITILVFTCLSQMTIGVEHLLCLPSKMHLEMPIQIFYQYLCCFTYYYDLLPLCKGFFIYSRCKSFIMYMISLDLWAVLSLS